MFRQATTRLAQRGFHTSRHNRQLFNNVSETIGRTPVVKINKLAPEGVDVYAKCEFMNPLGSVKDRIAIGMIEEAERTGALKPGQTVIEATSGNTGLGLAMVCAQKGYPFVVTMADSFSIERRKVLRGLGAKVILTPAAQRGTGMVDKAKELAAKHGWFLPRQFENDANPTYHANTTGPEILLDFANKGLDYFVTGYGTGGTVQGVGKVLRASRPETKIILAEPASASIIQSGETQERNDDGSPSVTHPSWTPHPVQGWTPDFIPKVTQAALDLSLVDDLVKVEGPEAIQTALALAQKEGLWTGISGGASMAAALQVAANAPKGSTILTMLPDTGDRYLSTPMFENITVDMNDEEQEISQSTPNFQIPPADE